MADQDRRFLGVAEFREAQNKRTEFDVEHDDFGALQIRVGPRHDSFHYFYDTGQGRLITRFLLRDGKLVDTVCDVVLIKKDEGGYSPRLTVWKRDKSKREAPTADEDSPRPVKASVRLGDCHETFWRLIDFLRSFKDIDLPPDAFRVADARHVDLLDALQGHDKREVLSVVGSYLQGNVTEREVRMLVNRRAALEKFERMLSDPEFVAEELERQGKSGPEALWQQFFEDNQWIFGYGLKLISCESYSRAKLEQITTGANVFRGGGKRIDAAMRTRGAVQGLLFTEIKRPDTDLLEEKPYRPPDVYRPTHELAGAVSQIQKTAYKAVRGLEDLHRQNTPVGEFQFEVSTVRPRQVVVIGNLAEFEGEAGHVNTEKMSSFELFRRDHHEVEIITFDELLERARFIVDSDGW